MAIKEDSRIEPTAAPDPYDDEPEEELEEAEAPRRRSGRVLPIVVASLAIVGFVVIVYYAYQQGIRAGSEANPPLIRAEDGPAKVRPAAPGGMEVPNQNMKVYELGRPGAQGAAAGPERILPKPEEPMQRPAAPQAAAEPPPPAAAPTLPVTGAPAAPGPQQAATAAGVVTPPPPPLPGSGQPMAAPAPTMAEVQTVLTPPAKQSNLAVPPPPPPPPRSGLVPGGRAPATASSLPPLSTSDTTAQAPPPAAPIPRSAAGPRVSAVPAAAAPAAPAPAATGATAGPARVQLGAPNSQAGAEKLIKDATAKYADLLGGLNSEIETHTDSRGTFYRVVFGPLASRPDAAKLCDALKAKGHSACLVR
jgi:hypothetical protein